MENVKELVVDETMNEVAGEAITEVVETKGLNVAKVGLVALGCVGTFILYKKVLKPAIAKFKAKKSEPTVEVEESENVEE